MYRMLGQQVDRLRNLTCNFYRLNKTFVYFTGASVKWTVTW